MSSLPDDGPKSAKSTHIAVVASVGNVLAIRVHEALRQVCGGDCSTELRSSDRLSVPATTYLYIPRAGDRAGMTPDLEEAQRVLRTICLQPFGKLILLSSFLVYGTGPARRGLVEEDYSQRHGQPRIIYAWRTLEAMAEGCMRKRFVVLRTATILDGPSLLSARLRGPLAVTLPGRNPMIQILSLSDLARAVVAAVDPDCSGIFNIAPTGAVPLNEAIRIAGNLRVPVLHMLQRLVRSREELDFLRYSSTISNRKMQQQTALAAEKSSVEVPQVGRHSIKGNAGQPRQFDDFGMDEEFIRRCGRTFFQFLADSYWRIEARGLEHIPREGRAVLVGTHRGFVPWDAMMALHVVLRETGRIPRFLTHPGLFKVPFIDTFLTKLGGVVASQESAGQLLEREALVGIYPEGVRGAFALLRDAYRIQPSWRNTFIKVAMRYQAPIIPFVNVGSADSLPVLAQIRSRRWTRISDWPCIPVSSFPLIPVPLPSKWRLQFLPPIRLEQQHPSEASQDPVLIRRIGLEVRSRMQAAMEGILRQRSSIFF